MLKLRWERRNKVVQAFTCASFDVNLFFSSVSFASCNSCGMSVVFIQGHWCLFARLRTFAHRRLCVLMLRFLAGVYVVGGRM